VAQFPSSSGTVRIFLCGDVMAGRGVDQLMACPSDPELREEHVSSAQTYLQLAERANGPIPRPVAPAYVWGDALDEWRRMAPDVRLVNLETAVTRGDDFVPKSINYRMTPENAGCLAAAGVDVCTLANNHVLDFGPAGLGDTLAALRRLGIAATGAGRTLAEASAPAVVPIAGRQARVIVLGAAFEDSGTPAAWGAGTHSPGVHLVEPTKQEAARLAELIAAVRQPGDIGIVSLHLGSNWGSHVPPAHRRFARTLVDTGEVSIVHGHSSHHPRPLEIYRDRLILYGCGDVLNDYEGIAGYERFRGDLVLLYFADVDTDGALRELTLTPLQIRNMRLNRPCAADARWLRDRLSEECRAFGVTIAPTDDRHWAATTNAC
jgi:poly-gamma-glutamate synthesis protein (capsule biosynthesis protein)